ncbi:MAG TPA: SpoIID/LytB domain-containing protein [Candidatus Eisenbacteria bacterium]|nr:SpoIID/LytB domain-containing protein [Candidatus Eisenbacteria bacterium]
MRRSLVLALVLVALSVISGCAGTRREEPVTTPAPTPPAGTPPSDGTPGGPPPPAVEAWRHAHSIRVGLAVYAPSFLVAGSTEWTLSVQGGREVARRPAAVPLQIARVGEEAIEVLREGEDVPLWRGTNEDTLLLTPSAQGYSGWGGKWYRGTFRIFASNPDGLTIVNEVDFESYLRSVLPHEIGKPPESDFEAVKAQAVAARSYTLSYLGRRAALGFDLYASVEDQVYGGISRENAQSDRALDLTKGEVLVSEGLPIRALYSSACGGRTSNVEDVWPWSWTPYLRSVRDADWSPSEGEAYCSGSSNYRWREEWEVDAFMASLRRHAPSEGGDAGVLAGDLVDVRVKSRGRSGRVGELAVVTTRGEWTVRGDRTRWAIRRPGKDAILRSAFLKIGVLRDRKGRATQVIATGAGNGHGIGLCQWGAMGMAKAGKSYRQILGHYYRRAKLMIL